MVRDLTCIICPRGCQLKAELNDKGEVVSVTGNTCPRGKDYAINECTHPTRTITSTVRAENGEVVPVKTNTAIPKELMFDCMKAINKATVKTPCHIGDVVIKNVLNTGADVIVTANKD